jgi:hypothetical protein
MTDSLIGMLLIVDIVVAMVALAWATLQPSRQSVWSAALCLSLLPAMILFLVVLMWVM